MTPNLPRAALAAIVCLSGLPPAIARYANDSHEGVRRAGLPRPLLLPSMLEILRDLERDFAGCGKEVRPTGF